MKCPLGISNFLEEISSVSHSIVFLYFFALITEEGFLISPCYSLELCIQMSGSFLFSFAFCFSCFHSKASSDNHFAFLHFFFLGMVLITASCIVSRTSVRSSSGTVSDLMPWIALLLRSTVSRAQAPWLWHMGLVVLGHVESSWTGDWTHALCIGM